MPPPLLLAPPRRRRGRRLRPEPSAARASWPRAWPAPLLGRATGATPPTFVPSPPPPLAAPVVARIALSVPQLTARAKVGKMMSILPRRAALKLALLSGWSPTFIRFVSVGQNYISRATNLHETSLCPCGRCAYVGIQLRVYEWYPGVWAAVPPQATHCAHCVNLISKLPLCGLQEPNGALRCHQPAPHVPTPPLFPTQPTISPHMAPFSPSISESFSLARVRFSACVRAP